MYRRFSNLLLLIAAITCINAQGPPERGDRLRNTAQSGNNPQPNVNSFQPKRGNEIIHDTITHERRHEMHDQGKAAISFNMNDKGGGFRDGGRASQSQGWEGRMQQQQFQSGQGNAQTNRQTSNRMAAGGSWASQGQESATAGGGWGWASRDQGSGMQYQQRYQGQGQGNAQTNFQTNNRLTAGESIASRDQGGRMQQQQVYRGPGQSNVNINQPEYHGKYLEEKLKYDQELFHLYKKLNTHFLNHDLKIARLDVVRFPEHQRRPPPPPLIFHSTTTRRTTTRPPTRRITPRTTRRTTTRTTTTTTTTPPPRRPYRPGPEANAPVGHVRIIGEVNVDENRFNKPVSLVVHGRKLNAHLNVIPKVGWQNPSDVVTFQEDPQVSQGLHPNFRFRSVPRPHPNHSPKPLHARRYLLYRDNARNNEPHNAIDKAIDKGIKSLGNFARSIIPGLAPNPKPAPKMHSFDRISPESPNYVKGRRYKPQDDDSEYQRGKPNDDYNREMRRLEKGLSNLIKTDKEIPRRK